MLVSYFSMAFRGTPKKTPVALLLASSLLLIPGITQGQLACDNDGIDLEWDKNVIELDEVKVKDMTGDKDKDREVALANPGMQTTSAASYGNLTVDSLNLGAFPDEGMSANVIQRDKNNVWKAEYPQGMYEFADENDIILEFEVTVIGGQASHIIVGNASTVSMSAEDAGIDIGFHGGDPKSLKQLEGDLNFRLFDLMQVATAGTHRANISLCVNVRGTI